MKSMLSSISARCPITSTVRICSPSLERRDTLTEQGCKFYVLLIIWDISVESTLREYFSIAAYSLSERSAPSSPCFSHIPHSTISCSGLYLPYQFGPAAKSAVMCSVAMMPSSKRSRSGISATGKHVKVNLLRIYSLTEFSISLWNM